MKETKTKIQHKPCGDYKEEVDVALKGKVFYLEHLDIQSESVAPMCISHLKMSLLYLFTTFSVNLSPVIFRIIQD